MPINPKFTRINYMYKSVCPRMYIHTHETIHFVYYLSTDGHLSRCHLLALMNNATMNMGVQMSVKSSCLFGYTPRSGIAGSFCNSIFMFFERSPYHFPQQLHHFTLLPAMGSTFFTSLSTLVTLLFLQGEGGTISI